MPTIESTMYFFNSRELARLAVYRAAVKARFYTDECQPLSLRHGLDVSRLLEWVRQDSPLAA
ncbi:MAG: hypothetical protein M3069_06030 [Chloroflexota bacterium]|nr:hypothetical protein [Chloroflexota bacterium]